MPPTPLSSGLQQLLQQQRRDSEQARTRYDQTRLRDDQRWRQQLQYERQQQQYQRQQLQLQHKSTASLLKQYAGAPQGLGAMMAQWMKNTGDWNRLPQKLRTVLDQAARRGAKTGEMMLAFEKYRRQEAMQLGRQQQAQRTQAEQRHETRQRAGHVAYRAKQIGLRESYEDRRLALRDTERQQRLAERQTEKKRRQVNTERKRKQFHLQQAGLSLLGGNFGGASSNLAFAALGAGPGAALVGTFAALNAGVKKTAQAMEILQNSTLNAGQKADQLAIAFIPGAQATIALRQALNGLHESLRAMSIQYTFKSAEIGIAGRVKRAELGYEAELQHPEFKAKTLGMYAGRLEKQPPTGAVLPRRTVAEEIAYQNRQRLLGPQYAKGKAEAEVLATKAEIAASDQRLKKLKETQKELLAKRGTFADASGAVWTHRQAIPFSRDHRMVTERKPGTGALGELNWQYQHAQAELQNHDQHRVDINRAAYDSLLAIEATEQNRLQIVDELNRKRQLGLTLAQKESAVRKAGIAYDKAEIANLQAKEQRSASTAWKIGSMNPAQRMMTLQALRIAQKGGLQNLPPFLKQMVEGIAPMWAQKEYEKFASRDPLWKELGKMQGKDFLADDLEGLRKTIQEKAAKVEVKIALDESLMAKKIAEMLGPVFENLLKQIKIEVENDFNKMRTEMIQHWQNSGP